MKKIVLFGILMAMLIGVTSMVEATTCESSLRFIQSEEFTLSVKGCTDTQLKIKAESEVPKLRKVIIKDGEKELVELKKDKLVGKTWILDLDEGDYKFVVLKPYPEQLSVLLSTK